MPLLTNPLFVGRHLITKPDCPKCDKVKAFIPPDVKVHDYNTVEGLTLMAWFEAKHDEFPILTQGQDVKVSGVINIMRHLAGPVVCPKCDGAGGSPTGDSRCDVCDGSGRVSK
jgi:hypothetical protein